MKRLLTALLALAFTVSPATAVAESLTQAEPSALFNLEVVESKSPFSLITDSKPPEQSKPEPKPQPTKYVVRAGDSLSKIGKAHKVAWQRLWAKNKKLEHPDVLRVGDKLTIPLATEKLKKRKLPAKVSLPVSNPGVTTASITPVPASSAGNTYDSGYCTWYAKSRRPDLPNSLGNADTWVARASAQGLPTGSIPRVGAIGQQGMHVVYVESVNGSTITISEMNYNGWGVKSSRTANASDFLYIY